MLIKENESHTCFTHIHLTTITRISSGWFQKCILNQDWNNYYNSDGYFGCRIPLLCCNNRSLISSSSSWSRNRALSFKHLNQIQNLLFLLSLIKFRKFRCSENYCRRLYATYCHYFVLCRILLCASWLNGVFRYKLCKSSSFKANLTTTHRRQKTVRSLGGIMTR